MPRFCIAREEWGTLTVIQKNIKKYGKVEHDNAWLKIWGKGLPGQCAPTRDQNNVLISLCVAKGHGFIKPWCCGCEQGPTKNQRCVPRGYHTVEGLCGWVGHSLLALLDAKAQLARSLMITYICYPWWKKCPWWCTSFRRCQWPLWHCCQWRADHQ